MGTTVTPGMVLIINEKEVTLAPDSSKDSASSGKHYALAEAVDLGTPADLSAFLQQTFGLPADYNLNTVIQALPSPLNGIAAKLASIDVSILRFSVTVPPTGDTTHECSFDLGMAGSWASDPIALGPLKIKGVYLNVVKDDALS